MLSDLYGLEIAENSRASKKLLYEVESVRVHILCCASNEEDKGNSNLILLNAVILIRCVHITHIFISIVLYDRQLWPTVLNTFNMVINDKQ